MLVMPSRAESFPYVVLEACAAGVPMVASRVGGIPEILHEDLLFEPNSAAALTACLNQALDDPDRPRAATQRTRQRMMSELSAEAMVNDILALYRDLARN